MGWNLRQGLLLENHQRHESVDRGGTGQERELWGPQPARNERVQTNQEYEGHQLTALPTHHITKGADGALTSASCYLGLRQLTQKTQRALSAGWKDRRIFHNYRLHLDKSIPGTLGYAIRE